MKVKRLILKRADSTELQRLQSILPTPVLAKEGYFILDTDASDFAVGGELRQVQDMCVLTIRYANSVPSAEQSRYCTTRKELIARGSQIYPSVPTFSPWLEVYCAHRSSLFDIVD